MKTYNNSKTIKKRIDKLLEKNAKINAELTGTDVNKTQRAAANKLIKTNAKKIKEIDPEFYDMTFGTD